MQQKQPSIAVTIIMGVILGLVVLAGLFVGWQFLNRRTESTLEASALDAMPEDVRQTALNTVTKLVEFDDPRGIISDITVKNVKLAPNPQVLEKDVAWCFDIESVSNGQTSILKVYVGMMDGKWTTLAQNPELMSEAGC